MAQKGYGVIKLFQKLSWPRFLTPGLIFQIKNDCRRVIVEHSLTIFHSALSEKSHKMNQIMHAKFHLINCNPKFIFNL